MKDPFYIGAIIHDAKTKVMYQVKFIYDRNPDVIRVSNLNHSVSFDVNAIDFDLIDPLQFFGYFAVPIQ